VVLLLQLLLLLLLLCPWQGEPSQQWHLQPRHWLLKQQVPSSAAWPPAQQH
jgi:hypothetical protein